ncbi:branched-chain amino acid ABC transporter substrate-binding protein [Herbaspirillum sp. 3R11]|nr:branched-chain amino acid ABC transporter substrate-binding protein [Herbaspirillum sp. 3R-3a1]TFI06234.1 branched-chain amino acid ABC transporter substrate-binding protein [Herbaspirillum sp. 3R11]TFI14154.1 branched-chain amino acid ABC transporter substrate-binding protein [Herbaspirillum sp. 3R-11]TFI27932.1 branched-chain amino acid ABC transporter substrate-binding protein [Herbaspirillum sp. 3C11]
MIRPFPSFRSRRPRCPAWRIGVLLQLFWSGVGLVPVPGLAQEAKVFIGFLAPLSGSNQARGVSMINGAQLAIEELNKKVVKANNARVVFELVPQDDRFDANAGKLATDYLLKKNPAALICHSSTVCIATAEQVHAARLPHISVGATNHKFTQLGYDNTFRMFGHSEQGGILFGHYVYGDLKVDRMAVIDDKTPSGMAMADQFSEGFRKAGGLLLGRYSVSDKTSDFNQALADIKESRADAIFWGGTHLQAANMIASAKRLGVKTRFLNAMNGMNNQNFLNQVNGAGNIFTLESDQQRDKLPGWKNFEKSYVARFSSSYIDVSSLRAYDAVLMVGEAIRLGNSADPRKLIDTLHAEKFKGLTGVISFDREGNLNDPVFTVYEAQGGDWKIVKVVKGR